MILIKSGGCRDGHRQASEDAMKLIQTEKTQYLAESKAGMDEKTARKYINSKKLPFKYEVC